MIRDGLRARFHMNLHLRNIDLKVATDAMTDMRNRDKILLYRHNVSTLVTARAKM